MDIFEEWRSGGSEIHWPSSTATNSGTQVKVFSRRCGTPGKPALVCVHGFPTSSIDYFSLTRELGSEFEIFLLDFPGYGFSDKPQAPYRYSLYDDARLLLHAITRVWMLERYMILTHDRGSKHFRVARLLLDNHEGNKAGSHQHSNNDQNDFFHDLGCVLRISPSSVRNRITYGSLKSPDSCQIALARGAPRITHVEL